MLRKEKNQEVLISATSTLSKVHVWAQGKERLMECDYGRDPRAGTGNHGCGAKIDDDNDDDDDGDDDDSDGDYGWTFPAPDPRAGQRGQK